jgi:hypothetical protein
LLSNTSDIVSPKEFSRLILSGSGVLEL